MAARTVMSTVRCMTSGTRDRRRVVIVGSCVAALERLLALRTLAGELVEGDGRATLISESLAHGDSDATVVVTGLGQRVAFDALVVATGASGSAPA
jgi:hypothetical protein